MASLAPWIAALREMIVAVADFYIRRHLTLTTQRSTNLGPLTKLRVLVAVSSPSGLRWSFDSSHLC
jgi:hypothetical protein